MNKLTIKMLAKELGLSVSTISKAIRDSHEISNTTKLRVNELVEKLNYVPNPYASSLRRRNSKTIGVVIPEVVDSFFAQAINGIESVAQEKGYHVLIYLTHESFEKEKRILQDFESGRVDGVLMSVSRETNHCSHIEGLMNMGVPLVFFDRVYDAIETTKVTTNDYESAYLSTTHLIEKGCKQILFLSFSTSLSISNKRLNGYKDALLKHNFNIVEKNILAFSNDFRSDYLLLKRKLQSAKRADGILASVEKLAITVYQACEDLQLNIPNDIQVISFSNLDSASFLNPPLTTITQPAFEIGKTAAAVLVKALKKTKYEIQTDEIIVPSTLIIRKSTKV
ncbi:MAG: LacI family DNA-binding transcriptional regulator [Ferruginibacter sp.]